MAGPGFVQDELELKFLILYIAARVIEPVPYETLWDLALCDDAVDYFAFSECLRDLVETSHLTCSEEGLYAITEKGLRNSKICESSLAYSVRLRCDKNVAERNRKLRRKNQVRSSYEQRPNGTYTVKLVLEDDMGELLNLRLMMPREDMAKAVSTRFQKSPEKLYNALLPLLLQDDEESK